MKYVNQRTCVFKPDDFSESNLSHVCAFAHFQIPEELVCSLCFSLN